MVILPILLALQLHNTKLVVSSSDMIESDCGIKAVYSLGGCYLPKTDTIIINSKFEWMWHEIIPHEYAHRTVVKENLLNEVPLYFINEEDMAEQFSDYWNNSNVYSQSKPLQAKWFRQNFIEPY